MMEYIERGKEAPYYYPYRQLLKHIDHVPDRFKEPILIGVVPYLGRAYRHIPEERILFKSWVDHFLDRYCYKAPLERSNFLNDAASQWSHYDKQAVTDMLITFRSHEFSVNQNTYTTFLRDLWSNDDYLKSSQLFSPEQIQNLDFLLLPRKMRSSLGLPNPPEIVELLSPETVREVAV